MEPNIKLICLSKSRLSSYPNSSLIRTGRCFSTDLNALLGTVKANDSESYQDEPLRMVGRYWLTTPDDDSDVYTSAATIRDSEEFAPTYRWSKKSGIRPVIDNKEIYDELFYQRQSGRNGTYEVAYGTYPQYCETIEKEKILEEKYHEGKLEITDKVYTFQNTKYLGENDDFVPQAYKQYYYQGNYYIRFVAPQNLNFLLSNKQPIYQGTPVWIKVSPVMWFLDEEFERLVSKRILISGIQFNRNPYFGDFEKTILYRYMNMILNANLFDKRLNQKNKVISENESLKKLIYRKLPYKKED